MNGKFSKGYSRLAKSYMALGNYDRALEAYDKATQVAPTDTDLLRDSKVCKIVSRSTTSVC
ncbi:MAG: tetratricopeptide repeat protein [Acidobacteriaceae bacterium]|nr:tetratricopeptide repeat protein [Acidobacteriaceae bacterium]